VQTEADISIKNTVTCPQTSGFNDPILGLFGRQNTVAIGDFHMFEPACSRIFHIKFGVMDCLFDISVFICYGVFASYGPAGKNMQSGQD